MGIEMGYEDGVQHVQHVWRGRKLWVRMNTHVKWLGPFVYTCTRTYIRMYMTCTCAHAHVHVHVVVHVSVPDFWVPLTRGSAQRFAEVVCCVSDAWSDDLAK